MEHLQGHQVHERHGAPLVDVNASLSRVRRVQCSPSRRPQPPRAGAVHGPVELCLSAGLWTSQSIIPQLKKPCSPECESTGESAHVNARGYHPQTLSSACGLLSSTGPQSQSSRSCHGQCPLPTVTRTRTLTQVCSHSRLSLSTLRLRHQHRPLHFHNSPFRMALIPGLSIFLMGPRLP